VSYDTPSLDLLPADGPSQALQRALDGLGSPLRVSHGTVKHDGRLCGIWVAAVTGTFGCDFWHRGVQHGSGWSASIDEVARAIDGFVRQRAQLVALHAAHGWIELREAAKFTDAAALVDAAWGRYLACAPTDPLPSGPLAALFAAASRRPRLRGLLPYTSLYTLCFSRTTGYPYTRDCRYAEPIGDERYRVRGPGFVA
jgi:hypothetical protein